MKYWIALCVLVGGCAPPAYCQLDREEELVPKIRYGEKSTDSRDTVRVFMENPGGSCTGTIIGEFTVVSAAHCIRGTFFGGFKDATPTRIYSPQLRRDFQVVDWEVHPEYNGRGTSQARVFEGDLMLLYFAESLPEPYIPVGYAPNGCFPDLIAQGYGKDENGNSGSLLERVVWEVDRRDRFDAIFTTEACWDGDSGGPLYAETPEGLTVIGALSAGRTKGGNARGRPKGKACLYQDLFAYRDWINERIY